MDLNALIDFSLVAANQGLGKASRASGRSKATLSRRITELEEQLGCAWSSAVPVDSSSPRQDSS